MSVSNWLPLESNPEVFQEYVASLRGPSNIQIVDLWAFEDWAYETLPKPVLAVIFVFPLTTEFRKRYVDPEFEKSVMPAPEAEGKIWFTRQTIPNACGTIALLHVLMNISTHHTKYGFDPQGPLGKLREGLEHKNPSERAKALESETSLEAAHHSVESKGATQPPSEEPVEHFVAFLELGGTLYELDGRMAGPISHGPSSPETFLQDAAKVICALMDLDKQTFNFSALAVCEKPPAAAQEA
eukprot:Gregarina_sp_Pseudo_9__5577@NODE_750_length_2271_cov_35_691756_g706_i0_p3_GENE_NODE_750_length_2271_cov_35_691756_g706_i0NODE_750_length_2271_cov_35_691756_g706_i0_p3_ORF_typecomplete_len241_score57_00Peptidase_C12/PF01088_21/3_6e55_NODE_750_length_2271_cov_35_691756_g706_i015162238